MPRITLPDGSVREFENPVSGAELAADIGPGIHASFHITMEALRL